MPPSVSVHDVPSMKLAAVRRSVHLSEIASAWKPALDQVWDYLRKHPNVRSDGHNVFLYFHPAQRGMPMDIDFGVEITGEFEPSGDVHPAETPAGEAAVAKHVGPYDRLSETHNAIHAWAAANGRAFAGQSWEIYGDWSDDASKLETTVVYLLR